MNNSINFKQLCSDFPLIQKLQERKTVFWVNESRKADTPISSVTMAEVVEA